MQQKFDNWNTLKQKIELKEPAQFRQGQIYFMSDDEFKNFHSKLNIQN